MHGLRRLPARGLHETEDLAVALVEPVAQILDAVLLLDLQVLPMGVRSDGGRQAFDLGVHVEVERHVSKLLSRIFGLAPARLLAEVDAEDRLSDDLVDEQGIRGMEPAAARVAVEALEL